MKNHGRLRIGKKLTWVVWAMLSILVQLDLMARTETVTAAQEVKLPAQDALSSSQPASEQQTSYFQDCNEALKRPEFKMLKTYYEKHVDESQPDSCFRLSNREFLVVLTSTGTAGQGLDYCDLKTKKGTCAPHEDGVYMPNLEVKREVMGPHGKRHVVFSTNMARGGFMTGGWLVLRLVPKTENRRGYVVDDLQDLGDYQDPESGLCGDRVPKNEKANDVNKEFEVRNEGTDQTALVFTVTVQDCSNEKTRQQVRVFTLHEGRFIERK